VIIKLKRTELIDQFTGSRKSRDKRMAASREKSGNMLPDTSETGRTIRRTVSAFTSIRMAISMKDSGKEISVMVKVHTGETKEENYVANILEIGLKIRNTEEAPSSTKMEIAMTAIG
jgi:hypothetical protein